MNKLRLLLFNILSLSSLLAFAEKTKTALEKAGEKAPKEKLPITDEHIKGALTGIKDRILEITTWPWIEILVLVAVSWTIGIFLSFVFSQIFRIPALLKNFDINIATSRRVFRALRFFVTTAIFWYGMIALLDKKGDNFIHRPLYILMTVIGIWLVISVWQLISEALAYQAKDLSREMNSIIIPFVTKFVKFIILFIGGILVITSMGVDVSSLWAMAGASTLVLGLAAKDSIENMFGSLTIVLDMPFGKGDWVKVNGVTGAIEQINIRNTKIRTFDDSLVTVPNGSLVRASIENFGLRRHRLIRTIIPVSKETPFGKLLKYKAELEAKVLAHERTKDDGSYIRLNDTSGPGYDIIIMSYLKVASYSEQLETQEQLLFMALELAESHDIKIISPLAKTSV